MNSLKGTITTIKVHQSLSLVSVDVGGFLIKSIVNETPETANYLKEGTNIHVLFKETEVVLGSFMDHAISLQNRLPGKVGRINKGELLADLLINTPLGDIEAVITADASSQMKLAIGTEVMAMIKTNEIMLSE